MVVPWFCKVICANCASLNGLKRSVSFIQERHIVVDIILVSRLCYLWVVLFSKRPVAVMKRALDPSFQEILKKSNCLSLAKTLTKSTKKKIFIKKTPLVFFVFLFEFLLFFSLLSNLRYCVWVHPCFWTGKFGHNVPSPVCEAPYSASRKSSQTGVWPPEDSGNSNQSFGHVARPELLRCQWRAPCPCGYESDSSHVP